MIRVKNECVQNNLGEGKLRQLEEKQPGLREWHKQDKLRRIKEATAALFAEKGFEATTIKEIAERAHLAPGTVFLYVKNKQELLSLIFYEGIETTVKQAFATLPPDLALLDELLHIFGALFRFYSRQISLARFYVKELPFIENTGYLQEAENQILRFMARLGERIKLAVERGELSPTLNIEQACRNFFGLYFATLLFWLSQPSEVEQLINIELRNSFELQIKGLQ